MTKKYEDKTEAKIEKKAKELSFDELRLVTGGTESESSGGGHLPC